MMFWKHAWRAIRFAACMAAFLSLAVAWIIWHRIQPSPVAGGQPVGGRLDVVALQIDILSITMAAVGIGLGAIGLLGYQALKEAAEARAETTAKAVATKKADEVATKVVAEHIEKLQARLDEGLAGQALDKRATIEDANVIAGSGKDGENGRNS